MKINLLIHCLLVSFLMTSCSSNASQGNKLQTTEQTKIDRQKKSDLLSQIEQAAGAAKGRVGAAATVLETGESVDFNGVEHFPMQSVYKFPIGMTVLDQVDQGKIKLEQKIHVTKDDFVKLSQHSPVRDKNPNGVELSVGELLRFMVSESDGTATDVLLKLIGGTTVVRDYLSKLKINNIAVANTEKEIGQDQAVQYQNWASPEGIITLLSALHEGQGLSKQSGALLLRLMTETPTGLKRLKGLLPPGTIVAHKTGTSGTINGITAATNDIGLIVLPSGRHLAIAVFVSDSSADDATREEVIAKIAQVAFIKWSK